MSGCKGGLESYRLREFAYGFLPVAALVIALALPAAASADRTVYVTNGSVVKP